MSEQQLSIGKELIHKRWIENETESLDTTLAMLPASELRQLRIRTEQATGEIQSVNGRYVPLLSQGRDLAQLASKSAPTFAKVSKVLRQLEEELLNPTSSEQTPIDDHGVRPGRKPAKRKKR